ncbi:hypothetical protein GCM10010276_55960 [Streptomyces longisporus]|uniref:Uncharacterized protein n=1 Tax=Streptomyces longisporus TaxID=1948 RepID=A0ABP5ZXC7_STRLO
MMQVATAETCTRESPEKERPDETVCDQDEPATERLEAAGEVLTSFMSIDPNDPKRCWWFV